MQWKIRLEGTDELGNHHKAELTIERNLADVREGKIGFSIEDGKKVMACLQQLIVKQQVEMYVLTRRVCLDCRGLRPIKDYTTRTIHTVFGVIKVRNPRICNCRRCLPHLCQAWAPLSEICPDQATPELMTLSARLGSLMPYRKAADVLAEFLPDQSKWQFTTLRHRTLTIGRRLEDRAQLQQCFDPPVAHRRCQQELPLVGDLDREFVISIDTAHVPRLKREGGRTFEVAVGHCARGGRGASTGTVFALASNSDRALRDRALRALHDEGYVGRGDITVLSDGAEFLKRLPRALPQPATHIIDWFHIAMKIQPLQQMADGFARREDEGEPALLSLSDQVWSMKWRLWHGQVDRAIALANHIDRGLATLRRNHDSAALKFSALLQPLRSYVRNNRASMVDYGARFRAGQRVATTMAESSVNSLVAKRMVKRQQMRWSWRGAHLMLQVRAALVNGDLEQRLAWKPRTPNLPERLAAFYAPTPPLLAAA